MQLPVTLTRAAPTKEQAVMLFETKQPQTLQATKQSRDFFSVKLTIRGKRGYFLCEAVASDRLIIVGCWPVEDKHVWMLNKINVQYDILSNSIVVGLFFHPAFVNCKNYNFYFTIQLHQC